MKLIWVHADCLHRQSPAYEAYPDSPSVFVWDDAALASNQWSMKRIGFIYECLLDLPVTIRRGDPLAEVPRYATEVGCTEIVTVGTPDPHLQKQAAVMKAEILTPEPFVEVKGRLDLARFSRYWRKVESALIESK